MSQQAATKSGRLTWEGRFQNPEIGRFLNLAAVTPGRGKGCGGLACCCRLSYCSYQKTGEADMVHAIICGKDLDMARGRPAKAQKMGKKGMAKHGRRL